MVYFSIGIYKYKVLGYNGLVNNKKGRPPKNPEMKKNINNKPRKLEESLLLNYKFLASNLTSIPIIQNFKIKKSRPGMYTGGRDKFFLDLLAF